MMSMSSSPLGTGILLPLCPSLPQLQLCPLPFGPTCLCSTQGCKTHGNFVWHGTREKSNRQSEPLRGVVGINSEALSLQFSLNSFLHFLFQHWIDSILSVLLLPPLSLSVFPLFFLKHFPRRHLSFITFLASIFKSLFVCFTLVLTFRPFTASKNLVSLYVILKARLSRGRCLCLAHSYI